MAESILEQYETAMAVMGDADAEIAEKMKEIAKSFMETRELLIEITKLGMERTAKLAVYEQELLELTRGKA